MAGLIVARRFDSSQFFSWSLSSLLLLLRQLKQPRVIENKDFYFWFNSIISIGIIPCYLQPLLSPTFKFKASSHFCVKLNLFITVIVYWHHLNSIIIQAGSFTNSLDVTYSVLVIFALVAYRVLSNPWDTKVVFIGRCLLLGGSR